MPRVDYYRLRQGIRHANVRLCARAPSSAYVLHRGGLATTGYNALL